MAQAVSVEIDLRVPAQKFWFAIRDSATLFPKIIPSQFESIEVIEGDGNSVGSTRHIKYGKAMLMGSASCTLDSHPTFKQVNEAQVLKPPDETEICSNGMNMGTHATESIEAVNESNMIVTYNIIECEILNVFKVFRPTLKILPGADANSCKVNWTVEIEPSIDEVLPPELIKGTSTNTFKAVEGYLLATA